MQFHALRIFFCPMTWVNGVSKFQDRSVSGENQGSRMESDYNIDEYQKKSKNQTHISIKHSKTPMMLESTDVF